MESESSSKCRKDAKTSIETSNALGTLDIDRSPAKLAPADDDIAPGQKAKAKRVVEVDPVLVLLPVEEVVAAAAKAVVVAAVVVVIVVAAAAEDAERHFTTSQPTASTVRLRRQSGQSK